MSYEENKWYAMDSTVFILEERGWRNGQPDLVNRISFTLQGNDISANEMSVVATKIADMLNEEEFQLIKPTT